MPNGYTPTPPTPQTPSSPHHLNHPDFYNDITRAKALELGEFKYNDE